MHRTDSRTVGQADGAASVSGIDRPSGRPPVRPLTALRTALKQIVGMPDYERYLAHARERHPDCPLLSEREFYDQFIAGRYGGGATRCC